MYHSPFLIEDQLVVVPVPQILAGDTVFRDYAIATMEPNSVPYGLIGGGMLIVRAGRILWVGPEPCGWRSEVKVEQFFGDGRLLTPGWIDCHTHLIFAGDRSGEFAQRLSGVTYADIARKGGGILSTVRATRMVNEEELYESARMRAESRLRQGVTTLEIKSGYGLDLPNEQKMLRVARRLAETMPLTIVATVLAAHTVPPEFAGRGDDYVTHVCEDMLPAVSHLADAVDVFCETIAFSLDQSRRILEAGHARGLRLKIHAEQLSLSGGAAMAARLGAVSADHLEYLDESGVKAMAQHGTTAVLLPGAYYFLQETHVPPIELLRKHQVPIALASDFNPGSSPLHSHQLVLNLACLLFRMTPEEALAGVTRNAARALGLGDQVGTLRPGKWADLAEWDAHSPAELSYPIAAQLCRCVFRRGVCVHAVSV
jgi:imidazolonepropionase